MTIASRRRSLLRVGALIFVAWSLFGALLGQQVYLLERGHGSAGIWVHAIAMELNYAWTWALLTPAVLWLGRAFPLAAIPGDTNVSRVRSVAVHVLASILCAPIAQIAHSLTVSRIYPSWFPPPSLAMVGRSVASTLDYGCILYWIVTLVGQSIRYVRGLADARVRQAELQEQLAEAQLLALRMQMHPHFLFNALGSVAELIHEDPGAAERTVTRLCDLLRTYMRSSETQEVSLAQEIDFLRQYLDIQKLRFEERLNVHIQIEPDAERAVVPSLILQPLVENAIVHGVADRERDGRIAIEASVHGDVLALRVVDNGDGVSETSGASIVEGRGLRNTRRRLERLYGDGCSFSLEPVIGGGICADIRIPFESPERSLRCAS